MIFQALCSYYERLREQLDSGIPEPGYSSESISYILDIDRDGRLIEIQGNFTSGADPRPKRLSVPQSPGRTIDVAPFFLWDKASYVLGVSPLDKKGKPTKKEERIEREHTAFVKQHLPLLEAEDAALRAVAKFLQNWDPTQLRNCADYSSQMHDANYVFRFEGEHRFVHERPAARSWWMKQWHELNSMSDMMCLVTGEVRPVEKTHPKIKGVVGAQTSGAAIVSFNDDAYTSYGKTQGENSPISKNAAFAYSTALNHLLRRSEHNRQRLRIGDTTVVFWAEAGDAANAEAAEDLMSQMLNPPATDGQQTAILGAALDAVRHGRPLAALSEQLQPDTHIFVLGLAPNASRLSIRFWITDTLQGFATRIAAHFDDLALQPPAWKNPPGIWRLALTVAPQRPGQRAKGEDTPRNWPANSPAPCSPAAATRAACWPPCSCACAPMGRSPTCASPCARRCWCATSACTSRAFPRRFP